MDKLKFRKHLKDSIIPFWNKLEDDEHGGFFGFVDDNLTVDKNADKGVILNSRILWFYSSAYQLLNDEELLSKAEHAYKFLKEYCYDKRRGGVYWSLTFGGDPVDTTKHTYNQAFAIYALSEYYMASGDGDSLLLAYDLFRTIEEKCRDKDGYLEAFSIDFTPDDNNDKLSENGVIAGRTMNTLLHVIEAYTNLYKADHYDQVGDRLREIVDLFETKVFNEAEGRMEVFFDLDYNTLIDLYSYGHDIETSWLLDRAAEVLEDEEYTAKIHRMTNVLADEVKKHAYNEAAHALFNECEKGVDDKQHIWWVQAEAVVGFYNAYQKLPERKDYEKTAEDIFSFILDKLVNPECGEWYESVDDDGKVLISRGIVHQWKCPYHNGRMCIEMCRRLED